jgi:ATP-binding protein involved in chromosome partitioning
MDVMSSTQSLTVEQVTEALAGVKDPEIGRPITELDMVKGVDISPDGIVKVDVYLTVAGCPMRDTITRSVSEAVQALPGVQRVAVGLDVMSEQQRKDLQTKLRGPGRPEPVIPFAQPSSLTRVYAVASGKGGVGKSSVTVNLAAALAASGQKVGVVDADIYGHSVPRMLGVTGRPTPVENMIMPPSAHEVKVISIGMFTKGNTPVIWRGPMLQSAIQQFLRQVDWGVLDYLLIDLPPGTGDVQLSLTQTVSLTGAVIVSTPQDVALQDARKAIQMFRQMDVAILGIVENMSCFECPKCGEISHVFSHGGGAETAEIFGVPFLGEIPLTTTLREGGDTGKPVVAMMPEIPAAEAFRQIAARIVAQTGFILCRSGV